MKLEHAMPITPQVNGEPLLKRSSFLSQFATILLVVWSANGDGCSIDTIPSVQFGLKVEYLWLLLLLPRLLPRLVPIYKMTILTDAFVQVIVSSIRTNRARKKILDLLDDVSGESSSRACL